MIKYFLLQSETRNRERKRRERGERETRHHYQPTMVASLSNPIHSSNTTGITINTPLFNPFPASISLVPQFLSFKNAHLFTRTPCSSNLSFSSTNRVFAYRVRLSFACLGKVSMSLPFLAHFLPRFKNGFHLGFATRVVDLSSENHIIKNQSLSLMNDDTSFSLDNLIWAFLNFASFHGI